MLLVGFYRLSAGYPGFVIPVFAQEDRRYVQLSPDGVTVEGFVDFTESFESVRFINQVGNVEVEAPKIGGAYILGFEYKEKVVAVGDVQSLRARVPNLIDWDTNFENKPFARLEAAQFLENEGEKERAAHLCFDKMNRISREAATAWLKDALPAYFDKIIANAAYDQIAIFGHLKSMRIRMPCIAWATIHALAGSSGSSRSTYINSAIANCINLSSGSMGSLRNTIIFGTEERLSQIVFGEFEREIDFWKNSGDRIVGGRGYNMIVEDSTEIYFIEKWDLSAELRKYVKVDLDNWEKYINILGVDYRMSEKTRGRLIFAALAFGHQEFGAMANMVTKAVVDHLEGVLEHSLNQVNR